jgi:tartrate dehydratase beta subunit/fumarate hydratase class I family protein
MYFQSSFFKTKFKPVIVVHDSKGQDLVKHLNEAKRQKANGTLLINRT